MKGGEMFTYSTDINNFIEKLKTIFEEGLNKIKTLNSIEEVVMEHLFKR